MNPRSGVRDGTAAQTQSQADNDGDDDFVAFYNDAFTPIARALTLALGDQHLASEAADEAMARCYSHWARVGHYDNPAGWVYRVGLNWATSLRRKLTRPRPTHIGAPVEPAAVGDPTVHQALAELETKLRAVVVCRFFFDWSVEDTAEALNIPVGTVKSRTRKALSNLERKLYHLGGDQ